MWKLIETCCHLAILAGNEIMKIYDDEKLFREVEYKADNSPLTLADRVSHNIITDGLKKEFPQYAILSEEGIDDGVRLKNEYCFVIDPLDGTKEFLKHNGQFSVNIALAYRHKVILGIIYAPAIKELYYAAKGMGSFRKCGKEEAQKISVSGITDLEKLRIVASGSHGCKEMNALIEKYHFTDILHVGSSLKGCIIARGDAEIYYRYNPTMEWDTAAMQCIAEEAGAVFRQMDDSEMLYNREDSVNRKGFYVINSMNNRIR